MGENGPTLEQLASQLKDDEPQDEDPPDLTGIEVWSARADGCSTKGGALLVLLPIAWMNSRNGHEFQGELAHSYLTAIDTGD